MQAGDGTGGGLVIEARVHMPTTFAELVGAQVQVGRHASGYYMKTIADAFNGSASFNKRGLQTLETCLSRLHVNPHQMSIYAHLLDLVYCLVLMQCSDMLQCLWLLQ